MKYYFMNRWQGVVNNGGKLSPRASYVILVRRERLVPVCAHNLRRETGDINLLTQSPSRGAGLGSAEPKRVRQGRPRLMLLRWGAVTPPAYHGAKRGEARCGSVVSAREARESWPWKLIGCPAKKQQQKKQG